MVLFKTSELLAMRLRTTTGNVSEKSRKGISKERTHRWKRPDQPLPSTSMMYLYYERVTVSVRHSRSGATEPPHLILLLDRHESVKVELAYELGALLLRPALRRATSELDVEELVCQVHCRDDLLVDGAGCAGTVLLGERDRELAVRVRDCQKKCQDVVSAREAKWRQTHALPT
jgi:hypothetical protein